MSEEELLSYIEPFRDERIWEKKEGQWQKKDTVLKHLSTTDNHLQSIFRSSTCEFTLTPQRETNKQNGYTLLEKGYVLE